MKKLALAALLALAACGTPAPTPDQVYLGHVDPANLSTNRALKLGHEVCGGFDQLGLNDVEVTLIGADGLTYTQAQYVAKYAALDLCPAHASLVSGPEFSRI